MVLIKEGKNGVWWVIPQFLCRLVSGKPKIMEPEKCVALEWYNLEDLDLNQLSNFVREVFVVYKKKYGNRAYYIK